MCECGMDVKAGDISCPRCGSLTEGYSDAGVVGPLLDYVHSLGWSCIVNATADGVVCILGKGFDTDDIYSDAQPTARAAVVDAVERLIKRIGKR